MTQYKIIIKENYVDVLNYDEIVEFTLSRISIKYHDKIIIIEGNNLIISKMIANEVLVIGKISSIHIN